MNRMTFADLLALLQAEVDKHKAREAAQRRKAARAARFDGDGISLARWAD